MKIEQIAWPISRSAVLFAAASMLSGCGDTEPKPDGAMIRAQTTIGMATTAGGAQYAAGELNSAESKLQSADAAEGSGDYKQARYFAEDALADAGLALAKTQELKAAEAARKLRESNQSMQPQVNQSNNPPGP